MACTQLLDALAIDVKPDHRRTRARERNGHRQAYVTEADDGDFSPVWQSKLLISAPICPAPV
jgi:hypothetical protein